MALLEELQTTERLVLLGDVIELRDGPVREALATASQVLPEIGEAVGPGHEVVIVPGNHDHHLIDGWLNRRAAGGEPVPLGLESEVDWWGGEPLASVAELLRRGGAEVRATYPGIWLREDVYATHGHYMDRHTTVPMFERLGAGAMARALRRPLAEARRAEDYEAVLAPIYALIHAVAQTTGMGTPSGWAGTKSSAQVWQTLGRGFRSGTLRQRALAAGAGGGIALLNRAGIGPVSADLSAAELRRSGLRAIGEVLERLSVAAKYVVFGHTHRAGPLPGDAQGEWVTPSGIHLVNSGCWVHEPIFLGQRPSESPYREGFAVRLDDDGSAPELVNLLDPDPVGFTPGPTDQG